MHNNSGEDTRQLFVTEIPLEATMLDMVKTFEPFGQIKKISFVGGSEAGPHNGHAFLEYIEAESGAACLEKARHSSSLFSEKMLFTDAISIRGKPVVVKVQRSREEILSRKEKKDAQNTHLIYEGRIKADDPAAEGVSPEEMAKRKRLWESKIQKLTDTNNKISETRLAVFNLPKNAGTGQIRKIFAIAPKKYARTHKKEKLSESINKSVIRITDVRKVEGQDDVAFVEFTKHEHALGALRHVNNNPNYFEGRRLIVEFAIVNSFVMKRKKKKEEDRKKLREKRFAEKEAPTKESFSDDDDGDGFGGFAGGGDDDNGGFEPAPDSDE
ncbi:hypothetical protein TRFO_15260 [Tritrichomonas foetus]|uniref:RRM domain-containing protein n=1 Tax=Tritrichomonas foetus TaxID=1144522 RepID=A0A1J4KST0_9EUKA|nr:hypothetical protein TRFO_15260 [Tritrichomonas foetus]|eukprot:OHT14351.1 hypothetical protein TRFO_15260 [Tritrichomonas foetus]